MPDRTTYDDARHLNRAAYNSKVGERNNAVLQPWKVEIRQRFLERVRGEGKLRLLDAGAGVGVHAAFFQGEGLDVVAIDASPAMVQACRAKGVEAWEMDLKSLDFEEHSFDAVFAMNSLLHVPRSDLSDVLRAIRFVLIPSGLLHWGQYGGHDYEGILEDDHYEPKRFFSFLSDQVYRSAAASVFEEVGDFSAIRTSDPRRLHYQSATWRRGS